MNAFSLKYSVMILKSHLPHLSSPGAMLSEVKSFSKIYRENISIVYGEKGKRDAFEKVY